MQTVAAVAMETVAAVAMAMAMMTAALFSQSCLY
jgi:hypothetical protein